MINKKCVFLKIIPLFLKEALKVRWGETVPPRCVKVASDWTQCKFPPCVISRNLTSGVFWSNASAAQTLAAASYDKSTPTMCVWRVAVSVFHSSDWLISELIRCSHGMRLFKLCCSRWNFQLARMLICFTFHVSSHSLLKRSHGPKSPLCVHSETHSSACINWFFCQWWLIDCVGTDWKPNSNTSLPFKVVLDECVCAYLHIQQIWSILCINLGVTWWMHVHIQSSYSSVLVSTNPSGKYPTP